MVPIEELPPVTPFTCQLTPVFVEKFTVAVNCWVRPPATDTSEGLTTTGKAIVAFASPVMLELMVNTDVMVTVGELGSEAGAVYSPDPEIVPNVALPPATPLTSQFKLVLLAFFTSAVNCAVVPVETIAVVGEIVIEVVEEVVLVLVLLPPPHPQNNSIRIAKTPGKQNFTNSSRVNEFRSNSAIESTNFVLAGIAYGVTFSVAIGLLTPPMLAVTSTVPGEMPVAFPLVSMLATPEKLIDQLKTALPMLLPFTSLAVAVNCCCSPTLIATLIGVIDTDPTVGNTVRLTAGLATPLVVAVAVIWVVPPLFPVAIPPLSMVATLVSLLVQVNVTVPTLFPSLFKALAVKA
jgi:hypothetical protein